MEDKDRLKRIAEIIEEVDTRCMAADGAVTKTLDEMTQEEISEIYNMAAEEVYCHECSKAGGAETAIYHLPPKCIDEENQCCPKCENHVDNCTCKERKK